MKLRVPGNYTGYYGRVPFENGVSTRIVSPREANHLRAIMAGVEVLEDDGETIDQALNSVFPILTLETFTDLGVEPPSKYLTRSDGTYPEPVEPAPEVTTEVAPEGEGQKQDESLEAMKPLAEAVMKPTVADLEKIADEQGIKGLRAIADPLGIKNNSIAGLIDELVKAGHAVPTPQE